MKKVTISEMIAQMVSAVRKLDYSESSIWTNIRQKLRTFAITRIKRMLKTNEVQQM